MMLRLALLGTPEITLAGKSLADQITGRNCALLAYLAVTGQEHTRNRLATLLWDERINDDPLKKIRNLLPSLRALLDDHLLITRESAAFNRNCPYWLDVDEFRSYLTNDLNQAEPPLLEQVLALYRGEFLGNFSVRNAPLFEEWVVQEREALHHLAIRGYQRLAKYYLEQNNPVAGLVSTKRLLTLEPWCEEAHQQQMIFLAWSGKRNAALAQYAVCQQVLADEFTSKPAAATTALYEQIRRGELRRVDNRQTDESIRVVQPADEGTSWSPATASLPALDDALPAPLQTHWHEIPQVTKLYGRQAELSRLTQWVAGGCRLIGIFGLGGQGKSALVSHFSHAVAPATAQNADNRRDKMAGHQPIGPLAAPFADIIWRSLRHSVSPAQLVAEWLQMLTGEPAPASPQPWPQQITRLLAWLNRRRCLLVLDDVEAVMPSNGQSGRDHPTWASYNELFQWIGASHHQSCLLLLSRDIPSAFAHWEEQTPAVRSLQLTGLDLADGRQLLAATGVTGSTDLTARLIQRYSGHPLALRVAAETIQEIFNGSIERFLAAGVLIFDELRAILDEQFTRLTAVERELLLRLVLEGTVMPPENLWSIATEPATRRAYLEAQRALLRRAWVEPHPAGVWAPALVVEYVADRVIEQVYQEVIAVGTGVPASHTLLNHYTLGKKSGQEENLENRRPDLLQAVARQWVAHLGQNRAQMQTQSMITALQSQAPGEHVYALPNLQRLLHYLTPTPMPSLESPTSMANHSRTLP